MVVDMEVDRVPTGAGYSGAMVRPVARGLRVVCSSLSEEAVRALAERVAGEAWSRGARILKQDERSSVLQGKVELPVRGGAARPVEVVVKSMVLVGAGRVLARWLGRTRGMRQWRGAERAMAAGVSVAPPLALFRGRDERGSDVEVLVLEHAPGRTLLELMPLAGLSARDRRALAEAVGAQVGALSEAGIQNSDHKPSNIVVAWRGGEPALTLIDTVGVRRAPGPGGRDRARRAMLFALLVEGVGTGRLVRASDRLRVVLSARGDRSRGWREDWRAVGERLARHGDPRPRTSPIPEAARG